MEILKWCLVSLLVANIILTLFDSNRNEFHKAMTCMIDVCLLFYVFVN